MTRITLTNTGTASNTASGWITSIVPTPVPTPRPLRNPTNTDQIATEYAQRGYVTFSIDYRLDPGNRCAEVQAGTITDPTARARETARCRAAIVGAQHDAQAVVRWVRANAAAYRVDPTRIAMGGFSAGAITALDVGYRSDDPGDVGDFDANDSRIEATISASGCSYRAVGRWRCACWRPICTRSKTPGCASIAATSASPRARR